MGQMEYYVTEVEEVIFTTVTTLTHCIKLPE